MSDHDKDTLPHRIRTLLDRDTQHLETQVQKRLDQMRRQALTRQRVQESVNDSEERLLAAARVALDDSVDNLPRATRQRLDQARQSALASAPVADPLSANRTVGPFWRRLRELVSTGPYGLSAGALATACVAVAAVTLFYGQPEQSATGSPEADVLLFASSEEIELYDNLEFYLWLADNGLPN